MSEIVTVGLDLAKNVFQVHRANGAGGTVLCKKLRRAQVLAFFQALSPCVVAMEACGGAYHWGREIGKFCPATCFVDGDLSFHSSLLEGHRTYIANGRVATYWIVEPLNVIEHIGARLFSGPVGSPPDPFGFE